MAAVLIFGQVDPPTSQSGLLILGAVLREATRGISSAPEFLTRLTRNAPRRFHRAKSSDRRAKQLARQPTSDTRRRNFLSHELFKKKTCTIVGRNPIRRFS
jgi:hypothetical protein